jgi:hypothetical protein
MSLYEKRFTIETYPSVPAVTPALRCGGTAELAHVAVVGKQTLHSVDCKAKLDTLIGRRRRSCQMGFFLA